MNLIGNRETKSVTVWGRVKTALRCIVHKKERKVWLRSFRIWQHRPHQVAPMGTESHQCASCGTEFRGNYCPRCGQSYKVGRFSFTNAMMHFLDVWGVGNRSMFRTLRDMIFRPGYMIRDYLRGMQSAYFPPFAMFFLFASAYLLVEQGLSLDPDAETESESPIEVMFNFKDSVTQETQSISLLDLATRELADDSDPETDSLRAALQTETKAPASPHKKKIDLHMGKYLTMVKSFVKSNESTFSLLSLILFSVPMFFFFRKTPQIDKLHFSEFIVALVYTANTFTLFSMAGTLFHLRLLKWLAILMIFITLKQLTGYSKRRVLGYLFLSTLISFTIFLVLLISACVLVYEVA